MFKVKEAKLHAKENVKKHYVLFVLSLLLAAYLGSAYTSTLSGIQTTDPKTVVNNVVTGNTFMVKTISPDSVLNELLAGKLKEGKANSEELFVDNENASTNIGALEIGRAKGVLSGLVNNISSGKFLIIVFETILSVTESQSIATAVFIILTAMVILAATIFIKDTYKIAFRRVFLEAYQYDKVKMSRFLFLFRVKKFIKASLTIFIVDIYQLLWDLTIVGGFIKKYEYYMVPYIIAENPDIDTREVISLSRYMMYGHKMECFKLELSFIAYWLLGALTLGLSQILFTNPVEEAVRIEYYVYIRKLAKDNGVSYSDKLNDEYLFKKANKKLIQETYKDVVEIMNDDIDVKDLRHTGLRGFIENNFGIIYKYDEEEDKYNVAIEQEEKISEYKNVLALKQYPGRLFPMPNEKKNPRLEHVHYLRHYSIWSIVALFFIFCFIGWSWEVMLHIVEDGVFVNRGVNHGPWLPIYGTGGVMILIVLFRFRNKPWLEFILSIILCGCIEYFASWYMEMASGGKKWWDYHGYFLNINGRVCAEGLLVFGVAGMACVYLLAPVIDNLVKKTNLKIIIPICWILVSLFTIDFIYSQFHPNTGKGITDYQSAYIDESNNSYFINNSLITTKTKCYYYNIS